MRVRQPGCKSTAKAVAFAGMALFAQAPAAEAADIDTLSHWNPANGGVAPWGAGGAGVSSLGQTFTSTADQAALTSFSFGVSRSPGTQAQFQGFVYAWDQASHRLAGSALYTSPTLTAPAFNGGPSSYAIVTVNTGRVNLTAGRQYALFFSTAGIPGQPASASYAFAVDNSNPAGSNLVFSNADLATNNFNELNFIDLAFIATFGPLALQATLPAGAPVNATNAAVAIDQFRAAGGTPPAGFNTLYSLSPSHLSDALTAMAGEAASQAQQGSFQIGGSFLSLMTDPFGSAGPLGPADGPGAAPMAYAPNSTAAIGLPTPKAGPSMHPAIEDPHWSVWGKAFGGNADFGSGSAGLGSHDASSRHGGIAAGADFRIAPGTLIGFSLAGGATHWSVGGSSFGGNGGGSSESMLAGLYGRYETGLAYVSAAAFASHAWMSTSRDVTVNGYDTLTADFGAQSWGGRLEGGYRLPAPIATLNVTPYAAIQGQGFHTPSFTESASLGSSQFALHYNSRTSSAWRGELGVRLDKTLFLTDERPLNLFVKVAYARDEVSNPKMAASFSALGTLPGTFAVYGAKASKSLALTTAGVEWALANGVSVSLKADAEFGNGHTTYGGSGRIRITW